MEAGSQEVKDYLTSIINPILKPMIEEIVAARPRDIFSFIKDYAHQKISSHVVN